jgi:serine/threonine protein kinase
MELINGMADSPLDEEEALWVLQSAMHGLSYLHHRNVIHRYRLDQSLHGLLILIRDVKAANLLVTRDADIKVADFGVSEKVSESIFGEIAGRCFLRCKLFY